MTEPKTQSFIDNALSNFVLYNDSESLKESLENVQKSIVSTHIESRIRERTELLQSYQKDLEQHALRLQEVQNTIDKVNKEIMFNQYLLKELVEALIIVNKSNSNI